jgi:hypothetical protein
MRMKKFLALVTMFGFLFMVHGAGVANGKPRRALAHSGRLSQPLSPGQLMVKGYCESSCCWASGCNVECSNSVCSASCGRDDTSITHC